ncbi:hypothetical protein SS50377_22818 [Spironucleus salmonicida]|uniref:Uncharacterized protein n=1 Tax=Spironucleus salmonicida TaxID=348837 RepID=A0A9P8LVQ7_9EUKA|nr:hypothetical protein SS50377_22812 [Spironucleus salmonicida]KAH0575191.1 hypothetical protein SS50377_22818 [Spironucleus salmonicida]
MPIPRPAAAPSSESEAEEDAEAAPQSEPEPVLTAREALERFYARLGRYDEVLHGLDYLRTHDFVQTLPPPARLAFAFQGAVPRTHVSQTEEFRILAVEAVALRCWLDGRAAQLVVDREKVALPHAAFGFELPVTMQRLGRRQVRVGTLRARAVVEMQEEDADHLAKVLQVYQDQFAAARALDLGQCDLYSVLGV